MQAIGTSPDPMLRTWGPIFGGDIKERKVAMSLKGKRVILCEDEGVVLMHLRRILTRAGMVIAGQTNRGDEAMALVARERPDIVLMDIELADMDGLEATQR